MEKVFETKTITRVLPDGTALRATAKIESLGGQHPYFSITGELFGRSSRTGGRKLELCGCLHEDIAANVPELAPFIRWHLTSSDGPMHYVENARYHAGFCKGMEDARNIEYLKSTIVYGALDTDANVDLESLDNDQLVAFLTGRFESLMEVYRADMRKLFGDGCKGLTTELKESN